MRRAVATLKHGININAKKSIFDYANELLKGVVVKQSVLTASA